MLEPLVEWFQKLTLRDKWLVFLVVLFVAGFFIGISIGLNLMN
ncbi:hypothetical protein [Eupransor demetentiae]|uniref:Uncharacterized protein n=1 Tax=Eupransor demetentiae TaxID=3109584 RepID=A0ABP0ET41_9LACO|nr:hypothetical protein R54876_GBNLAHCA_00976 [Lactobacillaceae bacterium LMG 33000]